MKKLTLTFGNIWIDTQEISLLKNEWINKIGNYYIFVEEN